MSLSPACRLKLKVFVLYIVAVAVVYAPVVFGGLSLSPAFIQPHGVVDGRPYGYEGRTAVNTFNVDMATPSWYEWPVNRTIGRIYRGGELPLWNPYQAGGTPLVADYSTRAFFPYQILEDISPPVTWDFFLLFRLVLAGFFTFLFLYCVGFSPGGAFAGGLFYMFSGVFVWFINLEQFVNVAMGLPLAMYGVELLLRHGAWRRVAFLATAFALVLLAGQPEVALYVLFLVFSYAIFRAISLHGRGRVAFVSLLRCALAFILGLMLAAPLILPFIYNVRDSAMMHGAGIGIGLEHLKNWKMIFSALTPTVTEIPADPSIVPSALSSFKDATAPGGLAFYRTFATKGLWDWLGGFTGVISPLFVLYFVFLTLIKKKVPGKGWFFFFLSFALLIVFKNLGLRPFVWLGALPFFDRAWSPRWAGPVWVFAFSMAGAVGFEALFAEGEKGRFRRTGGGAALAATGALVLMVAIFFYMPIPSALELIMQKARFFSPRVAPFITPTLTMALVSALIFILFAFVLSRRSIKKQNPLLYAITLLIILEGWWNVPRGYDYGYIYLKLIPLFIGLLAVVSLMLGKKKAAIFLCIVFVLSFMNIDLSSPKGYARRMDTFRAPPYVKALLSRGEPPHEYRVMGGYGVLMPNYAGAEGLYDLRYIKALIAPSFLDYRRRALQEKVPDEEQSGTALWFTGIGKRVTLRFDKGGRPRYGMAERGVEEDISARLPYYSLMGVKFILLPQWFEADKGFTGRLNLIYDKEVKIYENKSALPRAFVTGLFRLLPGRDDVLVLDRKLLHEEGFRKADIREYGANYVSIKVEGEKGEGKDGLLVLSDVLAPGWSAYVDGQKEKLYAVNGLLRGVMLKQGAHDVVFRYRPPGFVLGASLFFASLVICIFMALPWGFLRGAKQGNGKPHGLGAGKKAYPQVDKGGVRA